MKAVGEMHYMYVCDDKTAKSGGKGKWIELSNLSLLMFGNARAMFEISPEFRHDYEPIYNMLNNCATGIIDVTISLRRHYEFIIVKIRKVCRNPSCPKDDNKSLQRDVHNWGEI